MKFKAVQYEEYKWHSTIGTDMLSRRQRKTIVDKYNACLPCKIEKTDFPVNSELQTEALLQFHFFYIKTIRNQEKNLCLNRLSMKNNKKRQSKTTM